MLSKLEENLLEKVLWGGDGKNDILNESKNDGSPRFSG